MKQQPLENRIRAYLLQHGSADCLKLSQAELDAIRLECAQHEGEQKAFTARLVGSLLAHIEAVEWELKQAREERGDTD